MPRPLRTIGLLVVVAFVVAACGGDGGAGGGDAGGNGGEEETVRIGALHPTTGALAISGEQMNQAARMAVEDINETGGIESMGGARLELLSGDTQGDPATAQSEAQRLIQEGASALVGTFQSASSTNVARIAERSQIPFVMDVTVADEILEQGYQYTFRIQPNATGMGSFGAQSLRAIAESGGETVETIAYIHEQSEFGTSVAEALIEEAQNQGMEVVEEITYDALNVSDLTSEVTRAAAAEPDVIVVTGYYSDGLILARNAANVAPEVKAMYGVAAATFDAPQFPSDAGADAENWFSSNYHFDATSERATDVRERFEEMTGEAMRTEAMYTYQAVEVIADALERAGDSDPQALRDAIAETSLESELLPFPGPIEFDEAGENVNAQPVVMQVRDGEVLQVYPEEFAQSEPVFPATPWDEQ
jgi:branched-chain amino acid transport system substrate-binding protein